MTDAYRSHFFPIFPTNYSTGNPTRGAFERAVADAEGANYCVAFSSGSAATSAVVHLLQHGDHMLCIDDVYGGTQRYFRKIVSPSMGIKIDFVDMNKDIPFESNSRLLWLETPTNPTLKITDITKVSKAAKENNCLMAVDNTFCSPYFQVSVNRKLGASVCVKGNSSRQPISSHFLSPFLVTFSARC